MLIAFMLGITGSLAHCAGMCGPVSALLLRPAAHSRFGAAFLHLGRLAAYMLFGLLAGLLGQGISHAAGHGSSHASVFSLAILQPVQGGLALMAALAAVYFALSVLGRVPSSELLLQRWTRRWGRWMRSAVGSNSKANSLATFGLGMLWALLPCGLVMSALLLAAASTSPAGGALSMLAFGVGTLPSLLVVRWLAGRVRHLPWPRYASAGLLLLFGFQFAMRGLSSWGLVDSMSVGAIMLW